MPHQVTLQPDGLKFSVGRGETILESALDAGIELPHGCKSGVCGSCKAKLLDGEIDHGDSQEIALPAEEREAGMILCCCASPRSDISIERPGASTAFAPAKITPCRVEQLQQVAGDVMIVRLKLPSNERMEFLAGQYIEFLLEDGRRRAFSLANAPHDASLLEIHVRRVAGGAFTEHVFSSMKVKDILRIEGPLGGFYLREESDKPIIFVAGGTGFAPIKGLIEHAVHLGVKRPMMLYRGSRNRDGLYQSDLCQQWAAKHNIPWTPVLSDPDAADGWSGRSGLVHQAVIDDHSDLSAYQVYVCGAPEMCEAARDAFIARGLPAEEFFADVFSYAPR